MTQYLQPIGDGQNYRLVLPSSLTQQQQARIAREFHEWLDDKLAGLTR